MSNPTTTGEWMLADVDDVCKGKTWLENRTLLRDAINAALDAAKDWSPIAAENVKLTGQLAVEREPNCTCVQQGYPDQTCKWHGELAQLRDREKTQFLPIERQELQQQLAAEREKAEQRERDANDADKRHIEQREETIQQLQEQLGSSGRKVQTLVDALKEIAHCLADTDKWTCVSIARDALAKAEEGK